MALVVLKHFVPKPVDWGLSFSANRKSPYGASVARELLPVLFPGKDISVNTAGFYLTLNRDTLERRNLIIITGEFNPDKLDLSALLNFAARGNSVFISSLSFSDKLCDTLKFSTGTPIIDTALFKPVREVLRLSSLGKNTDSVFSFERKMPESRFEKYDTLRSIPLGRDRSGKVDFVVTQYGKGKIYLHCQPLAFTNFHLLYGNYQYASHALSYLPVTNTIWDQYYKPDKILDLSPVRYILSQPALKSAYFMLLATLLIYMVFGSRRVQRIIPVVVPERNTSLDFVVTVGKLYYRSQNHSDLARKKIIYFHDYIRNRYFIQNIGPSDEQVRMLSLRSGVEEEKIRRLLKTVERLTGRIVERQDLIDLHELLEDFYKNCK